MERRESGNSDSGGPLSACLENYKTIKEVGVGGFSRVYKGLDDKTNSVVAIKVVSELREGLSKALWKKEVDSLTRLSHPNIVRLLCSGFMDTGDSQGFNIVLEWMEETLSERYSRGTYVFSPNSWLRYSRGLVNGLAHAHHLNVAHRDVKPDNLLFKRKDDSDENIVIADFGISKNFGTETSTQTFANFSSMVFSPPDHASRDPFSRDVYSAAAVLVQLTTPKLFRDTLELQKSLESNKSLPEGLIALLRDSLELDPDNRPTNMIEFKSRFDLLVQQNRKKPDIYPALPIPVKFTDKPKEQLLGTNAIHFEKVKTKFESLLSGSEVYAKIAPPKKDSDDTSTVFHISTNEWEFTLKLVREEGMQPYLLLMGAMEPEFEELERRRFWSIDLEDKFRFIGFDTRQPVSVKSGVDILERYLYQRSAPKTESAVLTNYFGTWSRLLDAYEELIRGVYHPLDYNSVKIESGFFVFTLDAELEVDISDTSWEISDFRGVHFEVSKFDGTQVWTKPSREIGTPNQRGQLTPSLGRDAVPLSRQRTAVQEFKDGKAVSQGIGLAVESPSEAISVAGTPKITPVLTKLDADKVAAVQAALATDDLFVVQGPPGTGKTNFIAELVHQIKIKQPEARVLLVAQTHVAVDNALLRLEESGFTQMLRIGDPKDPRLHPGAISYLVEQKIKEWIEEIRLLAEADLVKRAGLGGSDVNQLKALAILSEINASRKQSNYLHARATQRTTAFAESLSEEDDTRINFAKSGTARIQEGLRGKLHLLSASIAKNEIKLSDDEMDSWVSGLISKLPDSKNLMKLLSVQTAWLLKVHTDADLRLRFLNSSGLVAGTCIGFLREPAVRKMEFDYCIVDEASKATATETLVPMSKAHRVILVGDDNQLPPNNEELLESPQIMMNHSLRESDVTTTLYSMLKSQLPDSKKCVLKTQWRMSKPIGDLISYCFYDGELESLNTKQISGYSNLVGAQVRWLDTSDYPNRLEVETRGGGYINRAEARIIASEASRLAMLAKSGHLKVDPSSFEILIVSPYLAQKRAIMEELRQRQIGDIRIRVETADAVQGSEADIVIVATTRSNNRGKLGFLGQAHWKRINVALSRARFGLIIVGDASFIESTSGGLNRALEYIRAHPDTCQLVKADADA